MGKTSVVVSPADPNRLWAMIEATEGGVYRSDNAGQSWIRVTVCYRKVEGRWVVVHEHVSIPFNCMTGMVAPIDDQQVAAAGVR